MGRRSKEWSDKNKERMKEYRQRWNEKNAERFKKMKKDYNLTPRGRYVAAQSTAHKRALDFTLTQEEYMSFIEQPCYYCEGAFGHVVAGVGLDRLDNTIGYVPSNVVSCCGACNRMKLDWLTPEETKVAVLAILQYRRENR